MWRIPTSRTCATAPQAAPKLPDIPQNLVKCIEAVQQLKDKSANAKMAALHLTAEVPSE